MSWVSTVAQAAGSQVSRRLSPLGAQAAHVRVHAHDTSTLPVIVQGGLTSDAYWYQPLRNWLEKQGLRPYVTSLPWHGMAPVEQDARALERVVQQAVRETGHEQVNIIGHSKGGLVGRYFLQRMDGLEQVRNLITIGTPHHGVPGQGPVVNAWMSGRVIGAPRSVRQLHKDSDFIQRLNGDLPEALRRADDVNPELRLTAVTGKWRDKHDGVVPAWSSQLPDDPHVRNVIVEDGPTFHHLLAVTNRKVLQEYRQLLGVSTRQF